MADTKSDYDVLNTVIDLSKDDSLKRPGDFIVKLGRPKKKSKQERVEEEGDRYIAELGSNDRENTHDDYLRENPYLVDFDPSNLDNIKEIKWGDFDVEKLVDFLVMVSEKLSTDKLYPYQQEFQRRVFRSILLNDGETLTALFSRQSGKSFTSSLTITTLCTVMPALAEQFPKQLGDYRKGFWVGIFAPTTHQARIVYDRVILTSQSSSAQEVYDDPDIATSLEKRKGYWKNGSFCVMQTASTKASIEGHTLHLILLEETQGIDEGVILRSIDPMGAFTNATTISIGTCDENPCWFYDMIQINKMRDVKVPPIYKNHFEYDYTEVIKYNEKYKRHVEKKIRERGIDSRWFQMKYGLRWFFEEGRPITDSDYKRFMQHITVPLTHTTDAPVVVGIDIGYERNASVVTVGKLIDVVMEYSDEKEVIRAVQICDWLELEKRPYPEQRPLIKSFLQHYPNIHCITIDTTGVGVQFFQEAELEWGGLARHMEMFKFNPPSKNYLMNLFYEYFWKRRIIIPSDKTTRLTKKWQSFYLQLLNLQKVVKKGYAVLEKNEREGSRDDFPDSLFLMLHAAEVATKRYRPIEQGPGQIYKDPHYPKARGMQEIRDAIREKRFGKRDSIRQQRAEKLLRGNIR